MFERDGDKRAITLVTVVWRAEEKVGDLSVINPSKEEGLKKGKTKSGVLVRVHPATFLQLWDEIMKVAKMQRPPVMVEDLRFEIGSIEITGPAQQKPCSAR
jgi:ribonuclease P/MRP protein subunit POP1